MKVINYNNKIINIEKPGTYILADNETLEAAKLLKLLDLPHVNSWTVGYVIKFHRFKYGFNQKDLAGKLGITQAHLSNLENDLTRKLKPGLKEKLSSIFGNNFSLILDELQQKKSPA